MTYEEGGTPKEERPLSARNQTEALVRNAQKNDAPSGDGWKQHSQAHCAGSYSFDDPDRPHWGIWTQLEREYDYHHKDGAYAYTVLKGRRADGEKVFLRGRRVVGSSDHQLAQDQGETYRFPGIEHYRTGTGDEPDLLYRLPDLLRAMEDRPGDFVFICEGEKDVDRLWKEGLIATTNPNGALNWKDEFNAYLAGKSVVVLVDNDDRGRQRGAALLKSIGGAA